MNYWQVIEEYVKSKNDWVDVEQIIRDTRVPEWIVEQWFKKVALNNKNYEIKMVFFGKWQRMVRLNGKEEKN